ncbi:hypothetical protein GCM10023080_088010 [Streptomyces pseudoechinosporeus]
MTLAQHALVVRGGWDGHVPATDRYATALKADGYAVTVSDTLDTAVSTPTRSRPRTWSGIPAHASRAFATPTTR